MNKIIIEQFINGTWYVLGSYELKFLNDEVKELGEKISYKGSLFIETLNMVVNSNAGAIKISAETAS
jgi:hypothetical protein